MKKLKNPPLLALLILLGAVLLLTGCFQDKPKPTSGEEIKNVDTIGKEINSENKVTSQSRELKFDYKTNQLILLDLAANAELEAITLDQKSFAKNIASWDQGYAVEVLLADEPVNVKRSSELEIISTPQDIHGKLLQIYDEELKLQKEIDLTSVLPQELLENEPFMAVSSDGSKIAWASTTNLYLYDIASGNFSRIVDETNNPVSLEKIAFTKDNARIVFFGSQADHDEAEFSYGFIELASPKIKLHTYKRFLGTDIQISEPYASFTDVINPINDTSSGQVLLLDWHTGEASSLQVDGDESTMARVTEDGKYLLAVKKQDASYRIRQYELKTGDVVKEEDYQPAQKVSEVYRIEPAVNPNEYSMILFTEDGKYDLFSFISEE